MCIYIEPDEGGIADSKFKFTWTEGVGLISLVLTGGEYSFSRQTILTRKNEEDVTGTGTAET